jgi:hypothetical protein
MYVLFGLDIFYCQTYTIGFNTSFTILLMFVQKVQRNNKNLLSENVNFTFTENVELRTLWTASRYAAIKNIICSLIYLDLYTFVYMSDNHKCMLYANENYIYLSKRVLQSSFLKPLGGFLRALRFPLPIKLTTTIYLKYC